MPPVAGRRAVPKAITVVGQALGATALRGAGPAHTTTTTPGSTVELALDVGVTVSRVQGHEYGRVTLESRLLVRESCPSPFPC